MLIQGNALDRFPLVRLRLVSGAAAARA